MNRLTMNPGKICDEIKERLSAKRTTRDETSASLETHHHDTSRGSGLVAEVSSSRESLGDERDEDGHGDLRGKKIVS